MIRLGGQFVALNKTRTVNFKKSTTDCKGQSNSCGHRGPMGSIGLWTLVVVRPIPSFIAPQLRDTCFVSMIGS